MISVGGSVIRLIGARMLVGSVKLDIVSRGLNPGTQPSARTEMKAREVLNEVSIILFKSKGLRANGKDRVVSFTLDLKPSLRVYSVEHVLAELESKEKPRV